MSIDPSKLNLTGWWKSIDDSQHEPKNVGEIWHHGQEQYVITIDKASYYRNDYWQVYVLSGQVKYIPNIISTFLSTKYGWSRVA